MMEALKKFYNTSFKMWIQFDMKTCRCYSQNSSTFRRYATLLGRKKVIILIDDWDKVEVDVKSSIWAYRMY